MQVAQGHIADPVEHLGRGVADPADADLALGLAGRPAGDEGMGHDDDAVQAARGGVGADALSEHAQHGRVRALDLQLRDDRVGQDERDAVHAHLPGLVGEKDRIGDLLDRGAQVDPGLGEDLTGVLQAHGAVVVAAGDHQRDPRPGEGRERPVHQARWHRRRAGHGRRRRR